MRRLGLLLGAAFLFVCGALLVARGFTRIAVSGHSMEPYLRDGDWLVVHRSARRIGRGDIVVAWDPRAIDRLIVKRVREVGSDSHLLLESDHPAHADEEIGPLPALAVVGRVRIRYWPLSRIGWVS